MRTLILAVVLGAAGCQRSPGNWPIPEASTSPGSEPSADFDSNQCGTIRGRVVWEGPIPTVADFQGVRSVAGGRPVPLMRANPHTPQISRESRGFASAVVSIANIDPRESRPWNWPTPRVEIGDGRIAIRQGDGPPTRVGLARRGSDIAMTSTGPGFAMLRARGAAYFTLPFPESGQSLTRRLDTPGQVAFSSGSIDYWSSADLFVADHPYFAITDTDGNFSLDLVPAGRRELVVWVRNWHIAKQEHDPESGLIFRQEYAPPVELRVVADVFPGSTTTLHFPLSARDFGAKD